MNVELFGLTSSFAAQCRYPPNRCWPRPDLLLIVSRILSTVGLDLRNWCVDAVNNFIFTHTSDVDLGNTLMLRCFLLLVGVGLLELSEGLLSKDKSMFLDYKALNHK